MAINVRFRGKVKLMAMKELYRSASLNVGFFYNSSNRLHPSDIFSYKQWEIIGMPCIMSTDEKLRCGFAYGNWLRNTNICTDKQVCRYISSLHGRKMYGSVEIYRRRRRGLNVLPYKMEISARLATLIRRVREICAELYIQLKKYICVMKNSRLSKIEKNVMISNKLNIQ